MRPSAYCRRITAAATFKTDPIPEKHLEAIIGAHVVLRASTNSHEISLVVVRNAASRARIAEIAGGQPWIAQARGCSSR